MGLVFQSDESSHPFLKITQDAIDLLESITGPEKALSVPYAKIWEVDPKTGEPKHGSGGVPSFPLSLQLVEPARFGASVDSSVRFNERPGASLERISIHSEVPKGIINYRSLELSFVAHRPDVIFNDPPKDRDSFSSLITPGAVHVLEYGWKSSGRHPLLNGDGFVDNQSKPPVIVPATRRIRFTVNNYKFQILPDGSIAINTLALEDGEIALRQATIGLSQTETTDKSSVDPKLPLDHYMPDGKKVLQEVQKIVGVELKRKAVKGLVTFQDVADALFAPTIERVFNSLGYKNVSLFMGNFNARTGRPASRYGKENMSDRPIGSFTIPLSDVEKFFNKTIKLGEQLTLYNFLQNFFAEVFRNPKTWDRRLAKVDADGIQVHTIPEIVCRSIANGDNIIFYIFDWKREFVKFSDSDRQIFKDKDGQPRKITRDEIRNTLRSKGVPIISFGKGNSYIQSADFDANLDDQMKTIFINRTMKGDRQSLQDNSLKLKDGRTIDPRQLLYSSSIVGSITLLGNFAFDLFGLFWIDFNIDRWDGPFTVRNRTDVIEPGSFMTTIELVSDGTDPLGSQGRLSQAELKQIQKDQKTQLDKKPQRRTRKT